MKGVLWFFVVHLCSLAHFAPINVLPDVQLDVRPPVVARDKLLGLVPPRMSRSHTVMVFPNDIFLKMLVLWDVDPSPCSCQPFSFLANAFSTTLSFAPLEVLILVKKSLSRDSKVKTCCLKCSGLSKTMFLLSFSPS